MIISLTKIIETVTYYIGFSPQANRVTDSIEFNNLFFIKYFFFNYVIKIYGHKMKYQSKNKNIFKIMITPKKAKIKIKNHIDYFPTNPILKDKIEKKTIKNN